MAAMLIMAAAGAKAQETTVEKPLVRKLAEERTFFFQATSMTPSKGGTRNITGTYGVRVKGDTLIVDLPYVGRVYSVDIANPGMNFESRKFRYTVADHKKKKDRFTVEVRTDDQKGDRTLLFVVFNNGNTTLNVTSSDREYISYNGRIANK